MNDENECVGSEAVGRFNDFLIRELGVGVATPRHLWPNLYLHSPEQIGTRTEQRIMGFGYWWLGLEGFLAAGMPDHLTSESRSNGYNSFWGMACCSGGLFVSLQFSTWYNDKVPFSDMRALDWYNRMLAPVQDRRSGAGGPECAVLYSQYRLQQPVLLVRPDHADPFPEERPDETLSSLSSSEDELPMADDSGRDPDAWRRYTAEELDDLDVNTIDSERLAMAVRFVRMLPREVRRPQR